MSLRERDSGLKPALNHPLPQHAIVILAFFSFVPAIAAGGAMGLPLLLVLAGFASVRFGALQQALTTPPIWLALLAAFTIWVLTSALWSDWNSSAPPKVAPLLLLGLFFAAAATARPITARFALTAATAAVIVLALLLTIEAVSGLAINRATSPDVADDAPSTDAARGLVVLMALCWPAIGAAYANGGAQRLLALAMLATAAALSFQFGQASAWVGLCAGCAACGLAWLAPRPVLSLGFGGLVLWLLTAPFLTPILTASPQLVESVPMSWAARVAIWRYTCTQILAHPWIGSGLEAGRAVTDRVQIRDWNIRGVENHPHSASLQIWYETGAIGALLAAALLGYVGWKASRAFAKDRIGAAALGGMLATIGVMANVGWSLWQEWWTATLIVAAALTYALNLRAARG